VSWVVLTKVVVRGLPFHCTTDAAMKLVPVTVSVKAGPLWKALLGASDVSVGMRLAAVMVKVRAPDGPQPGAGWTTVTEAERALAIPVAVPLAVSWVVLTKVVVRGLPFHCTTDEAMTLVPVTVRVKPGLPWKALLGASAVSVGMGLAPVTV